ncbi:hypothetical protein [Candidatus Berkiella aquae]|uniref:Uncharacterized protein n=1 Tax=Candidatus Berkiella aquae TaxID=295108 RepID=A0AAE3HWY2_9GAMM|nr:hypothetical protein [Candidatus Berkiella aquae]MCS5712106.1 hypothetical protein [Candidatus Berkiella aquae]
MNLTAVLRCWLVFICLTLTVFAAKGAESSLSIPADLTSWKGWVLKGHETELCPFPYNNAELHYCVWPADLKLTVAEQKATFALKVSNYDEAWITLPGDNDYWPQDVKVNAKAFPVGTYLGFPGVLLPSGEYTIEGSLPWTRIPDFIQVPVNAGTIQLVVNEKNIEQPDRDKSGKLWLKPQNQSVLPQQEQDTISVQVFRLFKDDIPLEQTTMLRLRVSGQPREVILGPILLPHSVPLRIDSPLTSRLEENGLLRLQVKPGVWEVTIKSRFLGKQDQFEFQSLNEPWPKNEIWSFQQQNDLRLVDIQGAASIDPQQTDMPIAWREFPAYLLEKGKTLKLSEMRRGQEARRAEQLNLQRKMWLDFSGKGFTLQDAMTGVVEQHWRLRQLPPYQLGRVTIDGQDKLITEMNKDSPGVEIRQGALNLISVSRIIDAVNKMPAVGWDVDVQSLSTLLHLPPGWMLLGASGVDTANGAWIQQWTLLDFFIVLVIAAATLRLLGWRWGLVALVMITLTYQERGAPIYSWLNLIAALALIVVLPESSRAKRWLIYYFRLSFVYLLLIALPFMATQIRNALYPQLTLPNYVATPTPMMAGAVMSRASQAPQVAMEGLNVPLGKQKMFAGQSPGAADMAIGGAPKSERLEDYDPNAKLQTGPGVPNWYWNQYSLVWNGPVPMDQTLKLWMLSAKVTSVLKLLQVLLMFALIYGLYKAQKTVKPLQPKEKHSSVALIGFLVLSSLCFTSFPKQANADIPDEALRNELRERLLEPPSCLPECAQISRMQVEIKENNLVLHLKANVLSQVAIPIPSTLEKWVPRTVLVNNVLAKNVMFDANQQLWLYLPQGVHDVVLEGFVGDQDKFELGIPLKPKAITQLASGWTIEGINRQQLQGEHLYFNRIKQAGEVATNTQTHLQASRIPPFMILTKTLKLGFEWEVINQLRRVAPQQGAIEASIPLLTGESVLSDKVEIKNGKAWVTLGAQENQIEWRSKLLPSQHIELIAANDPSLKQIWLIDAISQWHCSFSGIPMIHQSDKSMRWLPRFEPWNGEKVSIEITKPTPVAGSTVTIDDSRLMLSPGKRISGGELNFTVRASEGGAHTFKIPETAVLQDILINGLSQPINVKQGEITVPLNPGTQQIQVRWQEPKPIRYFYRTPLIDLQMPSSNGVIDLEVSKDRWIMLLGGPIVGHAVLFWGVLLVFIAISIALGRSKLTPLRSLEWFLLAMGLTLATPMVMIVVIAWFVAMNKRKDISANISTSAFQWMQVGLVLLTLIFVVSLFTSISDGLLGIPQMQLAGPMIEIVQSQFGFPDKYQLQWYQDVSQTHLAQAWLISLPMYVYRILMLLWALWLAFSLVKWLRWGWECFAKHGYWKERKESAS